MKYIKMLMLFSTLIGASIFANPGKVKFSCSCKIGEMGEEVVFGTFQLDYNDPNNSDISMPFQFPDENETYAITAEILQGNRVFLSYNRLDGTKVVVHGASSVALPGTKVSFFETFRLKNNNTGQLICS